ncbi:T9SS type A sorting domain-containing protein [Fluviicola taffensis]|uniref:T9SS type A sorting domain-containing protein n=1 Tax=Fluviicola taffensis TaxID=191579 RepID=UPI003137B602
MKRTLLSLSILSVCFFSNAQREIDLNLMITSHQDGDYMATEVPIDFKAEILNVGQTTLEASDSIYYYILIYDDSIPLSFAAGNAQIYTGIPYGQGQAFETIHTIGFSASFNGITTDVCVYGKPKNSANPISDPVLTNNKHCVSITFIDEADLSVGTNKLDGIQLSPNPANNHFSIVGAEDATISIADLNGNEVEFARNLLGEIDCSNWGNGIYLIAISNSKGNFVQRMVISH